MTKIHIVLLAGSILAVTNVQAQTQNQPASGATGSAPAAAQTTKQVPVEIVSTDQSGLTVTVKQPARANVDMSNPPDTSIVTLPVKSTAVAGLGSVRNGDQATITCMETNNGALSGAASGMTGVTGSTAPGTSGTGNPGTAGAAAGTTPGTTSGAATSGAPNVASSGTTSTTGGAVGSTGATSGTGVAGTGTTGTGVAGVSGATSAPGSPNVAGAGSSTTGAANANNLAAVTPLTTLQGNCDVISISKTAATQIGQ